MELEYFIISRTFRGRLTVILRGSLGTAVRDWVPRFIGVVGKGGDTCRGELGGERTNTKMNFVGGSF